MTQLELAYPRPFPLLTEQDMADFSTARKRVYELMISGKWHTAEEIIEVAGQREGLRRLRELRAWFVIDKRNNGNRNFSYKLTQKETI